MYLEKLITSRLHIKVPVNIRFKMNIENPSTSNLKCSEKYS